jgi:hypothetical protein
MKHMTYAKFMNVLSGWIAAGTDFNRKKHTFVSVMREPIDWFGSWYRYNAREALASPKSGSHSRYTGNISFDEYLQALLLPRKDAPDYAKLGGPCSVSQDERGAIGVDYLFRYTDIDQMVDFIAQKLERPITLQRTNISVAKPLDTDPATIEKVKEHFAVDFSIYDKLRPDGNVAEADGLASLRGRAVATKPRDRAQLRARQIAGR